MAADAARVLDHVRWQARTCSAFRSVASSPRSWCCDVLRASSGGSWAVHTLAAPPTSLVPGAAAASQPRSPRRPWRREPQPVVPRRQGSRQVGREAWLERRSAELSPPMDSRTTVLQMNARARHSTIDQLPQLSVSTLLRPGDSDRIFDVVESVAITRAVPSVQLTVLSAGHLLWLEMPERSGSPVADFCADPVAR